MATKVLSNEFMAKVLEDASWKELSGEIAWNEQLLEKHKDKLNWSEVSDNSEILWTSSMLSKFRKYIDWDELSECNNKSITDNPDLWDQFKNDFNWSKLSSNGNVMITPSLLDRFIDSWDWKEVIDRYNLEDTLYSIEFMEKYEEKIPMGELQRSRLWDKIVSDYKSQLLNSILQA